MASKQETLNSFKLYAHYTEPTRVAGEAHLLACIEIMYHALAQRQRSRNEKRFAVFEALVACCIPPLIA